jgi:hypothetical protein
MAVISLALSLFFAACSSNETLAETIDGTDGSAGASDTGVASDASSGDGSPACDPSHYTELTNKSALAADFCAYSYLPFRARMPATPKSIDQANTTILQQQYLPDSVPGTVNTGIGQLATLGVAPSNGKTGNSYYPLYVASLSDPVVSVDCAKSEYGCSDGNANSLTTIPSFHMPAWARPSSQFAQGGDTNIEVIQPNGDTALLYGCAPNRDWKDGDVIATGAPVCLNGLAGASYGNIVTSLGINSPVA